MRPVIVIGAGGHAKVLLDTLLAASVKVIGVTDADPAKLNSKVCGVPVIGTDEVILQYTPEQIRLVNGIGSIGVPVLRAQVFKRYKDVGYSFANAIHPSAIVAQEVELGEGVQIMAGAVIQPGCAIGANSIVNTRSSIDHDCHIGQHVHLAPGVTLSGTVQIGDRVHIGAGAVVIQGIKIAGNSLIGAGALVLKHVAENTKVIGVPAREG